MSGAAGGAVFGATAVDEEPQLYSCEPPVFSKAADVAVRAPADVFAVPRKTARSSCKPCGRYFACHETA